MTDHGACWRCRWFDRDEEDDPEEGFCRRYPPISVSCDDGCIVASYPGTGILEWCGEYSENWRDEPCDGRC